jgi:hypothetical protein
MLFILLSVCHFLILSPHHTCDSTFLALAIIAENSFWISHDNFPSNILQATEHYLQSPIARNVSKQIQTSFSNSELAIQSTSAPGYNDQIAIPLADLVINNLLRMLHLYSM